MTEENPFIPDPVKLETITNTKEINGSIDKIKNPFQNLKKKREEAFKRKMDWIENMISKE